jgi:hypothetical protein
MNKIEAQRYKTLANALLSDNQYYSQVLVGEKPLTPKDLLEILHTSKLLKSLGHVSNFYSDEMFIALQNNLTLDISKVNTENLNLRNLQQIVTWSLNLN